MAKRKGNTRRKRKGRKKERCRRNGESCFWRFLQLSLSALGISLTHSFATLFSRVDIYLFAPLSISPFSAASKNVPLFARTDCVHEIIMTSSASLKGMKGTAASREMSIDAVEVLGIVSQVGVLLPRNAAISFEKCV